MFLLLKFLSYKLYYFNVLDNFKTFFKKLIYNLKYL